MSMTEAEARRVRPMMSGVIALLVALVVAIGWYYAGRPDESTRPVATREWEPWVKAGRADGKLAVLAPEDLPKGWRATSARYQAGVDARWHLGLLTDDDRFVGLEESQDGSRELVRTYVDEDAERGEDVTIDGVRWQVWTDADGDYALVRSLTTPGGEPEQVLVVGTAPEAEIRDFAGSLSATSTPE